MLRNMIDLTLSYDKYNMAAKSKCGYISNIYVDAANPEVWESLKREFEERYDQQYIRDKIAECKKYNLHIENRMILFPFPFQ